MERDSIAIIRAVRRSSSERSRFFRARGPEMGMKSASRFAIVFVTAPDMNTARALARAVLQARLIACANLVPKIESHYCWQGKIESSAEVLMILKTQKSKLPALEKMILAKHPYNTPEFLVLPLNMGTRRYLDWLKQNCPATQ
jgi:periplasmic divalent cation tolerance protein